MTFKLDTVQPTDFLNIITAERNAFENPLQPVFRLYCPIVNNDRAKTISDTAKRAQESYMKQSSAAKPELSSENTWLKVIHLNGDSNKETDEILAGAEWIFHKESTAPTPESIKEDVKSLANRHPEGGARIFAEQAFIALRSAEAEIKAPFLARKAYMSLGSCFTAPAYRRKGLGTLAMEWGVNKADEMGLDIWIEAAPSAVPFYERHGFLSLKTFELALVCPDGVEGDERVQWEETRDYILPVTVVFMCRLAKKNI